MKNVAITMRVDKDPDTKESRDALDQRWFDFLSKCNIRTFIIPNSLDFLATIDFSLISGFILTGGNSLNDSSSSVRKRFLLEQKIIEHSIQTKKPLLGVCRGMQMIQNFFNAKLEKVSNHVKTRHKIIYEGKEINVNSFHNYGSKSTLKDFKILAKSNDGIIEALVHKILPLQGIMWHPERENPYNNFDINLFKKHFKI